MYFLEIKLFLNMHFSHHYGALIYYPDKTPPSSSITLQSIWPCVTTDRSLPRWMIPTMTLADPLFACRLQRFIRHVAFSWNRLEIIVFFDHLGPCWPIWTLLNHFRQRWFFCPKWTKKGLAEVLGSKKSILVWNGPKGSRWAQKGPKFRKNTLIDHFGPFWTTMERW